ncbi:MAG: family 78 glycoside hydrolase catalytic domain [Candidatus Marinimicrobia bacterium]|nr:family 78 glycoside hydrolase catalytic domain [Candidatus Neomarinimicrobiota bacterium]
MITCLKKFKYVSILSIITLVFNYNSLHAKEIVINNLRTEYLKNPIGIDVSQPRLSWQAENPGYNLKQVAYQILAANSLEYLTEEKNLMWNTGKVESEQSIHVKYKGKKLQPCQRVYWKVRIWDNEGNISNWSEPAFFETGLMNHKNWKAKWITHPYPEKVNDYNPCPYFRKKFRINKKIKSARLYISALGLYQAFINGQKVSDDLFAPGWTNYKKRVQYQTYDVTDLLKKGNNVIAVILGDGWYRGPITWQFIRNFYGKHLALISQLHIIYTDGTSDTIVSDKSWKTARGGIVRSEIYFGEIFDFNKEPKGWKYPEFNDRKWKNAKILKHPKDILIYTESPLPRVTKTLNPQKEWIGPNNEVIFDLGQNMTGWVEITIKGKKGKEIYLKHAEVLNKDSSLYVRNLRKAKQEDHYIFASNDTVTIKPHFTFHGFRYVAVHNCKPENIISIKGEVIHSDLEITGSFSCSDSLINRLQKNIVWSQRGNFLDVPTDCPQRDERLGWTGDAQVFCPTASFNMNTATFYSKWLKDFLCDQTPEGKVPWVIPNVIINGGGTGWSDGTASTGWSDAIVTIPYNIYLRYGDTTILKTMYDGMKKWCEYMISESKKNNYIYKTGFHFGDWLAFSEYYSYRYRAPDYGYAGAHTDKDLIATAYMYHSTNLLKKMAEVLNIKQDVIRYDTVTKKIKEAFIKEFITPTGRIVSNTQTAYSMALMFGLVPEKFIDTAAARLSADVKHFGHITTGFLGTPLIMHALTDYNYTSLAYMLLMNKRYPSWLYPVTMGATTIWERWDGIKPDGSYQTPGMNSFNHYAYGAIGDWLYSKVAGINPDISMPGYKKIIIYPHVNDTLKFVTAIYNSMYGKISSSWKFENDELNIEVDIPFNTVATIILPCNDPNSINIIPANIITKDKIIVKDNRIHINTGSGKYIFKIPKNMVIMN